MRFRLRVIPSAAVLGLAAATSVVAITVGSGPSFAAPPTFGGHGSTLFVSNGPGGGVADPTLAGAGVPGAWSHPPAVGAQGCANAPYTTISSAVAAATAGATIVVCPGVYDEDVVVPTGEPLTIEGIGNPVVDAFNSATSTSLDNGVQVLASGTTVEGLTVSYATGEGILVGGLPGASGTISNVTIRGNTVSDNDRGNPTGAALTSSSYAECIATFAPPAPPDPGDCGEGIHLLSADNSTVEDNVVTGNSGGILLTDENGPTDGDLIASNDVFANSYDCGITVAGHHLGTTTNGTTWSTVLPTVGGVFNNTIRGNESNDNGVLGQGGGILLATGTPGGAVYDNLVEGNFISGNGLAGVTVHSHSPGEDLSGNTIRFNTIGTNNLDGDFDFGNNAPPTIDPLTTGVIVADATGNNPISITVDNNRIENDHNGIWTTPLVTGTFAPNIYFGVTTDT
jgi:parallel beta-helix repeat protein